MEKAEWMDHMNPAVQRGVLSMNHILTEQADQVWDTRRYARHTDTLQTGRNAFTMSHFLE